MDVPAVLARFEDLLLDYTEDFKTDALSDDLKKEAYKEMIPGALEQTVTDVVMFRNLKEDTMTSAEMKSLIGERITNQVIRMDVDAVDADKPPAAEPSGATGGRAG